MRIDFSELKARIPIEEAAKALKLELKESNGELQQFRSPCPTCRAGGDRALAVTPGKGYFCNADRRGGDLIALTAHIRGGSMRQAAEWLVEHFNLAAPAPQTPPPQESKATPDPVAEDPPNAPDGLQPLKNLDHAHELVQALKLPVEVATALGIGYCAKGLMRNFIAIPLRLPSGKLIGYIGVKDGKLPTKWNI